MYYQYVSMLFLYYGLKGCLEQVYATCEMLPKACDLYYDVVDDGIVPDAVRIASLLRSIEIEPRGKEDVILGIRKIE